MKKTTIFLIGLFLIALLPLAIAAETAIEPTPIDPILVQEQTDVNTAGTTPDSPIWGLERAWERVQYSLTFGAEAKSEKALQTATERLYELKLMTQKGNVDAAVKAQAEYAKTMEQVKEQIGKIDDKDSETKLKKTIKVEEKLQLHIQDADKIKGDLEQIKEKTQTQNKEKIGKIVDDITAETDDAEKAATEKQEKAKVEYKAKEGKTDEEVGQEEARLREQVNKEINEETRGDTEAHIKNMERKMAEAKTMFGSETSAQYENAQKLMEQAKTAYQNGDMVQAKEDAKQAMNEGIKAMNQYKQMKQNGAAEGNGNQEQNANENQNQIKGDDTLKDEAGKEMEKENESNKPLNETVSGKPSEDVSGMPQGAGKN